MGLEEARQPNRGTTLLLTSKGVLSPQGDRDSMGMCVSDPLAGLWEGEPGAQLVSGVVTPDSLFFFQCLLPELELPEVREAVTFFFFKSLPS